MGYLSGSSPHIKSGAVSALSLMVYNDLNVCFLIPDLVPSVLQLLQSKAVEVIKAVLGFVKVLVSGLQVKDLQNFLSGIINGVLPWSSTSRHHFRSKVTVILEIVMRKSGSAVVKLLTPDKYRNFVKIVMENRHGKANSREDGTTEAESKSSDFSSMGRQKRKREESGSLPNKDNTQMEFRDRKRGKKQQGAASGTNEPHISSGSFNRMKRLRKPGYPDHGKPKEGQLQGGKKNRGINFNKDHSSNGNRKIDRTKTSKKNVSRPTVGSKQSKQRTVERKQQEISNKK
ncbi:unnamed protein product [Ilex paraguariensis]|uniref:RRP12-like protein n=1 Tax=Ilex paraguariensis TaxID=185542 RepID=A0ABC8UN64_9AQUA